MIRTAAPTARRITGSPRRPARLRMKPGRSAFACSSGSMILPVSIRLQVEALTKRDPERPAWLAQSAEEIFSAISLSRVSSSGVRSSASARHISASPSGVERPNSCRKLSTTPWRRACRRAALTSSTASSRTASASAPSGSAAISAATAAVSSSYLRASRLSQSIGAGVVAAAGAGMGRELGPRSVMRKHTSSGAHYPARLLRVFALRICKGGAAAKLTNVRRECGAWLMSRRAAAARREMTGRESPWTPVCAPRAPRACLRRWPCC